MKQNVNNDVSKDSSLLFDENNTGFTLVFFCFADQKIIARDVGAIIEHVTFRFVFIIE